VRRWIWIIGAALGFLGVALGAFGAHGLKKLWQGLADAENRAGWWQTASFYHLVHALALVLVATLWRTESSKSMTISAVCFACGIVIFCGSLYVMSLTGMRALGAVTPIGGLLLLAGWLSLAIAAL